ncbi:hypothetical protein Thpro_020182 [Acidihalobacter prosperus]|uniref:Uncharacterized protein n=1 Tax=Acidihalobacter prosperus TaxID=160660 RepID=A0A1A6C7C7_9GAMM|nr:hypothetical protein Thpro_020182 [Acidihalobacter prosperus]
MHHPLFLVNHIRILPVVDATVSARASPGYPPGTDSTATI